MDKFPDKHGRRSVRRFQAGGEHKYMDRANENAPPPAYDPAKDARDDDGMVDGVQHGPRTPDEQAAYAAMKARQ